LLNAAESKTPLKLQKPSPVRQPMPQEHRSPQRRLPQDLYDPMAPIVEGVRKGLFNEGYFTFGYLGYAVTVSVILLSVAVIVFNKVEKSFIDTI
jgi:lipopolysaccharide transport system permease protein